MDAQYREARGDKRPDEAEYSRFQQEPIQSLCAWGCADQAEVLIRGIDRLEAAEAGAEQRRVPPPAYRVAVDGQAAHDGAVEWETRVGIGHDVAIREEYRQHGARECQARAQAAEPRARRKVGAEEGDGGGGQRDRDEGRLGGTGDEAEKDDEEPPPEAG